MDPNLAFLKPGDKIGLIAPARSISEEKIILAEKILESWELIPVRGKYLLGKKNQFSGNIENRLFDIQYMFNNPDIKAVLCAGGGYGAIQLVEKIEFQKFLQQPKWLIGFSDITILHSAVHRKTGFASIHGTMPVKFDNSIESAKSIKTLQEAIFGKLKEYAFKPHQQNITGKCEGKLIGGNLSILSCLIGTSVEFDYTNKILFIEEVDEYLYHIDRMMYSMHLSGNLRKIKGLLVGNFSDLHDNKIPFGRDEKQIILDAVKDYNIPVAFDFPAGHESMNKALYLNKEAKLTIEKERCTLQYI